MTFHGKSRMDEKTKAEIREPSPVIWVPLILLAIPAVVLGILLIKPILFNGMLGSAIYVAPEHNVLGQMATEYKGPWAMALHALVSLPFWFAIAGILVAWFCYLVRPDVPGKLVKAFSWLHYVLIKKYGFDDFNQLVFVRGTRKLAGVFYRIGDVKILDDCIINGSGRFIIWASAKLKRMQTGYLYHFALAMIIGVLALVVWQVLAG
jgi:NADH-quinone oxidoreductase subunit L